MRCSGPIFDIEDCAKDEETLLREFNDYITDDRVFGIMCHKNHRHLV